MTISIIKCKRCGVDSPADAFAKSELRPSRGSQWCRPCVTEYKRAWKEKNRRAAGIPKKVFKKDLEVYPGVFRCLSCSQEKQRSDFSKSSLEPRGRAWCRACVTAHVRVGGKGRDIFVAGMARYRASGKAKETKKKWRNTEHGRLVLRELVMRRRDRLGVSVTAKEMRNHYSRLNVLQRGRCTVCKEELNQTYHVDHVMPLALGGRHEPLNLQLLCPPCNRKKHAIDPVDFMQQQGYLL